MGQLVWAYDFEGRGKATPPGRGKEEHFGKREAQNIVLNKIHKNYMNLALNTKILNEEFAMGLHFPIGSGLIRFVLTSEINIFWPAYKYQRLTRFRELKFIISICMQTKIGGKTDRYEKCMMISYE